MRMFKRNAIFQALTKGLTSQANVNDELGYTLLYLRAAMIGDATVSLAVAVQSKFTAGALPGGVTGWAPFNFSLSGYGAANTSFMYIPVYKSMADAFLAALNVLPTSINWYVSYSSKSAIYGPGESGVVRPSLNTSKFKLSVNLNQAGYYSGSGSVTLIAG